MSMGVEVRGTAEIVATFEGLLERTIEHATKGLKQGLKIIEGDARNLASVTPSSTGALRRSIRSETKEFSTYALGKVVAHAEYAGFVEVGTGDRGAANPPEGAIAAGATYTAGWPGMEAQPYLYPAFKANKAKVMEMIRKAAQKGIRP